MSEDLIPFFTYNDVYLKQIYRIDITVVLPKLRQSMGQSVSNWEIRQRLKKRLDSIEVSDFKVLESTLEEVKFAVIVCSAGDLKLVIKFLNGISFRAVGFTEPLTVAACPGTLDFPTRVDWDEFFASNSQYDERNFGERPDTIYIGGLPFEWFKSPINSSYEETFKHIFREYGPIKHVDIPQLDPLRKQMEEDISGIRLSSWSFGQDPFFEIYIQFKEYSGFVNAMNALCGKTLVQKNPGALRETKIKVDFDKTAHLSQKKITQRDLRRAILEESRSRNSQDVNGWLSTTAKLPENDDSEKVMEERKLTNQLIRTEKRRKIEEQKNYEQILRKKLKKRLTERMKSIQIERERGAKDLLIYISKLHKKRNEALKYATMSVNELAEEYVKEQELPEEEKLREILLKRQELKLRSRIAERILANKK